MDGTSNAIWNCIVLILEWQAPERLLQEDNAPSVTRNTTTDVYALGMVCRCDAYTRHYFADLFILDLACMYSILER